ncbi:MAG: c-type cytochrome [Chthoniobacteraceae bacterium]
MTTPLALRLFALFAIGGLFANTADAANLLALDFNADPAPLMEAFVSSETVKANGAIGKTGTIDTFRGERSGAAVLTVDASAAKTTWSAGMRTPLLAVANAETSLAKLTLSFDLQASQSRPVRVRVASFDAKRKRNGGLEKWVYPPVAGSFYRHSIDLSEMNAWNGVFDPAAPFIQLSWEIAGDAPQPWPEADGLVVRVDNVSFASPSFYVSATGSDKADGHAEATAFATIKKGIDAAQAGDTVLVIDGVYPLGGGVSFTQSGAPAKWITLKRAPGAKPRAEFVGWSAFAIKNGVAYVEVNGFEIVGNARHVTLEEAQENGRAEKPDGKFNGSAIAIEGNTLDAASRAVKDEKEFRDRPDRPHHVRIIGCDIHDACGAGVNGILADYLTIEGNTVSDCASRSRYAHSGISMYWAWNFDASTEHRNFIRNNVAARNRTMVAWQPRWEPDASKAHLSDGNGIIIDDFIQHQPGSPGEPNLGRTLVQNNLSHHSGGGGIHIFASDRVDVINNTAFANCQTDIIDYGEIDTSWSKDCRVFNNVAVASPGKTVHRSRSRQNKFEPSNTWAANVLFADGKQKVTDFSARDVWTDPLLRAPAADAPASAFAPLAASPARGCGIDGELVSGLDLFGTPRGAEGKIDGGAIQFAATSTNEPPIPPVPDKQPEPPFPKTPAAAGPTMLVPGFTVRELPVKLTSLNNIEYAPDGRLFAGGYDGRFHLLRDTDGDGLEDKVDTFSPEPSANYPLGMAVKDGEPYAVLTDEVVRWRDTNGDGVPDLRETVVKGFDNPELMKAPYLNHRRVDSSMALAIAPDGAIFVTMGNAGYNNAYWHDKQGVAHYSPDQRRGCLLRFGSDGKAEQLSSGLRYIMALQFNKHGDLFGTDQEGATWVPNGNPLDELLHIEPSRHYGFPPRHPRWLPGVIDEPSVVDYGPQHESTCGFRFNGPLPGRGRFGPESWADDAFVTGESRGKLWRTKLAKTAAGYVARTELIARMGLMAVDCAISPQGDLVVCCHTGAPDWGNGPKGEGRIFKISLTDKAAPEPVLTWAASETETVIAFDRALDAAGWQESATRVNIDAGRYVEAADRMETIRPGYAVVKMQLRQKHTAVEVKSVRFGPDGRSVVIETAPRDAAVNYALSVADKFDLAHDLSGVAVAWSGEKDARWSGWLPHADFAAAQEFTRGSAGHDALWKNVAAQGQLTLRGQLDLWQMLIPATQPLSKLDYEPEPETVTVVFKSDAALTLEVPGANVERISEHESRLTVAGPQANKWTAFILTVATPAQILDVSYFTARDPRPRALATRRFLMPFAKPGAPDDLTRTIPEIAGGNWEAGHALFKGKAACATCHQLRGDGVRVGPELSNLIHSDYASLLRNITDPNASINPDAVGYTVTLKDGSAVIGTRLAETEAELQIAQPGGGVAKLKKADISKTEPMTVSLMPVGLDKALTPEELRDLMTYLLTEPK